MSEQLTARHCKPCEGGTEPLDADAAGVLMKQLHADWARDEAKGEISRTFRFRNYYQTMAFVNAVAWIAHQEDHHPDLEVGYNRCHVRFSTHAIGGLSENDFIGAAKVDALVGDRD
ncbi:MAG: 4a-hydroxytetrahydrobiopterin dehydratase [Chromatiales bacterium 21-64-14]|nr:MAG: 4a-hydroxytetrahydrobiopterin dehydratase [Chromatiales bacterium 21-64-14]HQU16745.1 4a-hydroxytetrahydrobiopterin dehydratase [Gammaproteobacteria bacterium]